MQRRPTYETEGDRQRELEVAEVLARKGGMKPIKLKEFSNVDFALMKGDAVWGVIEVKVRNKLYPQMMLSLHKVQSLRDYAALGLEARVVYATPEGIYVKKVGPERIDGWIGFGGRTDRGDEADQELMVFFGGREEQEPIKRVAASRPEWFHSK